MKQFMKSPLKIVFLVFCITTIFWHINNIKKPSHSQETTHQSITLQTIYGTFTITEPVIIELLSHPLVKRLKYIRQYGPNSFVKSVPDFTRYDHSIGVFVLLRKYGASLNEQIAGLLHDASHTVFSHAGDFLFDYDPRGDSYQDDIAGWFLKKGGIGKILETHGLPSDEIINDKEGFSALEQRLPDICADRLEYNLRGGFVEGMLTRKDIATILEDIRFEENKWVFTSPLNAKQFAMVPLYHTEHVWTSPWSMLMNSWLSKALKRAMDIKLLSMKDIHFSLDHIVWKKLQESNDRVIAKYFEKMHNSEQHFSLTEENETPDTTIYAKFRGIDPLVKTPNGLQRLTKIDNNFNQQFNALKKKMATGWKITFHKKEQELPVKTTAALALPT